MCAVILMVFIPRNDVCSDVCMTIAGPGLLCWSCCQQPLIAVDVHFCFVPGLDGVPQLLGLLIAVPGSVRWISVEVLQIESVYRCHARLKYRMQPSGGLGCALIRYGE